VSEKALHYQYFDISNWAGSIAPALTPSRRLRFHCNIRAWKRWYPSPNELELTP
jgi:hypothetical protein